MAMNFAGVSAANDQRNDIIIRGNSPGGLLWRLEDVDIPNPNHFAEGGPTGGPVGMLNNNLLENSDFFTGAFPAEYGNALSGLFDLNMRSGNNEKHEQPTMNMPCRLCELNSIDYLLKPVNRGKLQAAIEKLRKLKEYYGTGNPNNQIYEIISKLKSQEKSAYKDRFQGLDER